MTETIAGGVIAAFTLLVAYTYAGYPALLMLLRRRDSGSPAPWQDAEMPMITILVAVYNEEAQIRDLIESLLALDYPAERRQILIMSDASSDRTDEIVREYAPRGVELVRLPNRGGKTLAENAATEHIRGELVINTDASIRIRPGALRPMIAAFADSSIGVVSGRDVSVSTVAEDANKGEGAYVDYEMRVRDLETRAGGIVGASGCFFAIRRQLQAIPAPPHLSRDFAAALVAKERGLTAVSMPESLCAVPRSNDVRAEYRRKVRTFTRGMETLAFKKHLLNPFRTPLFAWKLFSHKICRWAIPWFALAAYVAVGVLAFEYVLALVAFLLGTLVLTLGVIGWLVAKPGSEVPRWLSAPAYALVGSAAVLKATILAVRGERAPVWEPTRRVIAAAGQPIPSSLEPS